MKRKMAVLGLVLMLALGMTGTTALAAQKPSARLYSVSTWSVRRGRTQTFRYKLNSGSYRRKYGIWRSKFVNGIYRGSLYGRLYAYGEWNFTGNVNLGVKWNVPRNAPKGRYVNLYGTFYRSGAGCFRANSAKTCAFSVR